MPPQSLGGGHRPVETGAASRQSPWRRSRLSILARRFGRLFGVSAVWLSLWLIPVASFSLPLGTQNVFSQIALFFSKMAMVTFGGAYAVLAYVAQQAVQHYGWLKPGEMLDGLGMAETTPGPLIMVLQFVGFMAAYPKSGLAISPAGRDAWRVCSQPG